jgi:hypothetical protein
MCASLRPRQIMLLGEHCCRTASYILRNEEPTLFDAKSLVVCVFFGRLKQNADLSRLHKVFALQVTKPQRRMHLLLVAALLGSPLSRSLFVQV